MPYRRQRPLVLVIDDDPMVRLILCETLRREALEMIEADSGESGLELFHELNPDLVLLDVVMERMDGFAVCRKLREAPGIVGQTPIIMLTGLEDVESVNRAYEAGATDFVTKPVNWDLLPHRVRYVLRASRAFAELAVSEASLAQAQRLARLASWSLEVSTGRLYCAVEIDRLLSRTDSEPLESLHDLLAFVADDDRAMATEAFQRACEHGAPINIVFRASRSDGEEAIFHAQSDSPQSGLLRGMLQDITERRRTEDRISFLALHDELTGLPNRSLLKELSAHEFAQAWRCGFMVAGLFIDLYKFQRINETFGHDIGDQVLIMVAARLLDAVSDADLAARSGEDESNKAVVARLGGDQFGILLSRIRSVDDVGRTARRIVDHFAHSFHIEGRELYLGIRIGITLFPDDCSDFESFMRHGDSAMHFAKARGGNTIEFFNQSLNAVTSRKLHIETQLRHAVKNGEMVLHYQPKIDASTGAVSGVEALVRWHHPELGLVPPMQFIPVAEESGLIIPIGEWVFHEACRQCKAWEHMGLGAMTVAVNLSATQFRLPDLSERIIRTLDETGLDAARIEMELTESMLVDDVESVIDRMNELRDRGIRLSIDDFGTGYSSLTYLMRFPLHALKIDKSFVNGIVTDRGSADITSAIISMAKSLNLQVVAEGVETAEQARWLTQKGCDMLQGYYFSRPLPGDALAELSAAGFPFSGEG